MKNQKMLVVNRIFFTVFDQANSAFQPDYYRQETADEGQRSETVSLDKDATEVNVYG